jgi:hypothetical protein
VLNGCPAGRSRPPFPHFRNRQDDTFRTGGRRLFTSVDVVGAVAEQSLHSRPVSAAIEIRGLCRARHNPRYVERLIM